MSVGTWPDGLIHLRDYVPTEEDEYDPYPDFDTGTPWTVFWEAEPGLRDLWREIHWSFGTTQETCPVNRWYGWRDARLGQKHRLKALFGSDTPAFWGASKYLTGAARTCLHCLQSSPQEADLESELAGWLELAHGRASVRRQVVCRAGRADIVTPATVIELKLLLTRDAIVKALGQAVLYRAALGTPRIAIGGIVPPASMPLVNVLEAKGIRVVRWHYPPDALAALGVQL